jgi:hypothetical protein
MEAEDMSETLVTSHQTENGGSVPSVTLIKPDRLHYIITKN